MTTVVLAPAEPLHAGAIGRVVATANAQMPWLPRVFSAAEEIGFAGELIDTGAVTVARCNRDIVGFIAVCRQMIGALYVLPERQNQGIGTRLLHAAQRTSDRLRLWSYIENENAIRFYRRHGFVDVDRTDGQGNEAGLPDICLEWTKGQE